MKLLLIILCFKGLIEARLLGFADKLLRSPTLELGPGPGINDLETGNGTKQEAEVNEDEGDKICFDKMSIIEETQYDSMETCNHSYQKKCHTTYVTQYQPYQEEECKESFKKSCHLSMQKATVKEQVEVCRTPLVKTCDRNFDTNTKAECKTMYESECWTKYEKHEVDDDVPKCETVNEEKCDASGACQSWPREVCQIVSSKVVKTTPKSGCDKVPRTMCYTANCDITEGPLECHEEPREVLVDRPVEECGMEAFTTCRPVTRLAPSLEPKQTCRDVPREICSSSKVNPRKVRRPVIRRVCVRKCDQPDQGGCPPGPPGCEACPDIGNTEICDPQHANCQYCSANTCKQGCLNDKNCPEDMMCLDGRCVTGCLEDKNCDGGYECIDGTCRPPPCQECLDENNVGVCDVEKIDRQNYTTCSFCQNQTCVPGCLTDLNCPEDYECFNGACRHGPGKVLLHSINIKTATCKGCSQEAEGARLTLMGEVIGEALTGYPCSTNILDTDLVTDFSSGSVASFDGKLDEDTEDTEERRSMGSCFKAPLNAQLQGGSLQWTGAGAWTPASVCVDWLSSNMAWTCDTLATSATSWDLVTCKERTPRQKCAEFFT